MSKKKKKKPKFKGQVTEIVLIIGFIRIDFKKRPK